MPRIFEDERRRNGPISANPLRTGWIFPPTALRLLEMGPASPAQTRLAGEKCTAAGLARGQAFKLHVVEGGEQYLPTELLASEVNVHRAAGEVTERAVEILPQSELGHEWEWEETPEISLCFIDTVAEAVELFNSYSPLFEACLISNDDQEHQSFYDTVDAPFVGDGYTRWVDGQFALHRPELGLSNWRNGRLFARGSVLSGDGVFTVLTRYRSE